MKHVIAIPLSARVVYTLTSRIDAIGIDIFISVKWTQLVFVIAKPSCICSLNFFRVWVFSGKLGANTDEQIFHVSEL
jgi:hypothetical protein